MAIWKKLFSIEELNKWARKSMVGHIGVEYTEIGDCYIKGEMPVDERTRQPFGILHGGASVALAETLGSTAAFMAADKDYFCVGLEINANHLSKIKEGKVIGTARPVHIGGTTQVWEIRIDAENKKPVSISRMTLAVLKMGENSITGI